MTFRETNAERESRTTGVIFSVPLLSCLTHALPLLHPSSAHLKNAKNHTCSAGYNSDDDHLVSLYCINTETDTMVMRIKELITKVKSLAFKQILPNSTRRNI